MLNEFWHKSNDSSAISYDIDTLARVIRSLKNGTRSVHEAVALLRYGLQFKSQDAADQCTQSSMAWENFVKDPENILHNDERKRTIQVYTEFRNELKRDLTNAA